MIIADALAALWSLGWAGLVWFFIAAAAGTAVLFTTIWLGRALWRAVRPRRRTS